MHTNWTTCKYSHIQSMIMMLFLQDSERGSRVNQQHHEHQQIQIPCVRIKCQNLRDVQCCLQVSRQSGESLGHPRILPWCPLRHRPPCCPEDPLDIPGSQACHHSSSKLLRLGRCGPIGIISGTILSSQKNHQSQIQLQHQSGVINLACTTLLYMVQLKQPFSMVSVA